MKNEWKIPAPWPLLLLLASIIIFGASCGIVNKNRKSNSESFDSTTTQTSKKDISKQKDSSGTKSFENTGKKKSEVIDSGGVQIKFAPAKDSARVSGPIKFSFDTAGYLVSVDPGGREVESINQTRKKRTAETETTKQAGSDSARIISNVQVNTSDSTHTEVQKKKVETESHTFRFQIPWYAYLIGGLLAIGVWYFWPYLRRKKQEPGLPYNSPKDNS